jgi:hypothetical protein
MITIYTYISEEEHKLFFPFLKNFNYGLIIDSNEKMGHSKKIPSLFPPP